MEITMQTRAFYFIIFNCVYMCAYASMCAHKCRCSERQEKSIGSPEAAVTGSCEPVNMGAGTQGLVLWVPVLSYLSSPRNVPINSRPTVETASIPTRK